MSMLEFPLAFPEDRRFDDRRLRMDDDGWDLEAFVFEVLAQRDQSAMLAPRLAKGRDGAIDLVDEGEGERCVIECKFIGKNASVAPADRWREVYKCLASNLKKLVAAPDEQSSSQYAPWLDTAHRIVQYRFCVSAPFATQARQDELRRAIERDFAALAESHARLRHLADIRVEILSWDYFHGQLRLKPALRVRWFGDLPQGVEPLRTRRPATTFKAFLDEDTLPFFSRAQFAEGSGIPRMTAEDDWIEQLADGTSSTCLLVTGPGGVGKTRLAIELGKRLEARDWLVLRASKDATGALIEEVFHLHGKPANVAFIVDYAEAASNLSGIIASIRRAIDVGGHRARLIATCRASALQEVRDALADLDALEVMLASDHAGATPEDAYARWVVDRILESGGVPNAAEVAAACDGLPVLAAFALFLYERAPDRFAAQFGDLLEVRDFKT